MAEYILTRSGDELTERERLRVLQAYQDPPTIQHLAATGVSTGWNCLDVGAGGGSITRWLAERVGPTGTVLATDIELDLLSGVELPNVTVRRHDVRTDPMQAGWFDLVHTRYVLIHLPERQDVLGRMVASVRPGGRIVIGDVDFSSMRLSVEDARFEKVAQALDTAVRLAGWDPEMGPKLAGMLERCGVRGVEAAGTCGYQRGGSAVTIIMSLTLRRIRPLVLAQGVSEDELDYVHDLLLDSAIALQGPTSWTAWGTKH
jgi:SAM-dependent methyltransferase